MTSIAFLPYQNETETYLINDLTVENRLDRISIYGSVDITKDKAGLEHALILKRLLDATIDELKRNRNLPEHIEIKPAESVENPF